MQTRDQANLLDAARAGDRRARERVVEHYLPVVRSVAFRYHDLGLGLDDLVQEGSLGLLEAIQRFDPSRGRDFESFARFRIRRSIRSALTEQSRLIRLPKEADPTARDPEDEAVQHEEIDEVDEAVACLPDRQHEIISRHFGLGCDAEQIGEVAETLHVSPQRAREIERDALYALRKRLDCCRRTDPAQRNPLELG